MISSEGSDSPHTSRLHRSIGTSTLDVVRRWPDRFGIHALVAGRNVELLARQIAEFRPQRGRGCGRRPRSKNSVEFFDENGTPDARARPPGPEARGRCRDCSGSGFRHVRHRRRGGSEATYEAVRLGKRVGLANKEVLVAGGKLVTDRHARLRRGTDSRSTASTTARTNAFAPAARRSFQADPDRLGRTFPRNAGRGDWPRDSGAGPESSHLEDGAAHHHRLGDLDEQGLRGDRGLLAVRLPAERSSKWWCIPSPRYMRWWSTTTAA